MNPVDVLGETLKNTKDPKIVLLIVLAICAIVLTVPLYRLITNAAAKKREQYFQREQLLIKVVQENAKASTKLSTVLENMNNNCEACKAEQMAVFHEIQDKQQDTYMAIKEVKTLITERK